MGFVGDAIDSAVNLSTFGLVDGIGAGDFLGGTPPSTQQIANTPNLTPEQRATLNKILGSIQGLNLNTPIPGASQLQQQGFQQAGNFDVSQSQDALSRILNGEVASTPATTSGDVNSFFNTAFREPALRSFTQDVLPKIQESFIGNNAGRSAAADRAITRGFTDVQNALDPQLANLIFNTEQAQLGRQAAAQENALNRIIPATSASINLANAPINALLGAGNTQRQIDLSQNPQFSPLLNLLPTTLGTTAVNTPVFQQTPGTTGLFSDLLGLGGQFLGTETGAKALAGLF